MCAETDNDTCQKQVASITCEIHSLRYLGGFIGIFPELDEEPVEAHVFQRLVLRYGWGAYSIFVCLLGC